MKRPAKRPARARKTGRKTPANPVSKAAHGVDQLYGRIQTILAEARAQAWRAINSAMVNAYCELTAEDENPPLGIVLCTDKNEAVVRYTLPEGNNQIFAARYKLYLPSEAELAAEVQRERMNIELHRRLADADA